MSHPPDREPWLRGPIEGIPSAVMPVAHSLQQVIEDLPEIVRALSAGDLWQKPGGAASVGFHIKHLTGSLDRLFTYARGEALSEKQMAQLKSEKEDTRESTEDLVAAAINQLRLAQDQLRSTDPSVLFDERKVGRAGIPSTCIGLLFHAAEHTQRHLGAIIATTRILKSKGDPRQ